ncbi:MAG: hypothetical protein WCA10_01860 [Terracidiphilus sp.]
MESLDGHSSLSARSGLNCSHITRLRRSTVKIRCLMAILLLVGAANSGRSHETLLNLMAAGPANWTLATSGSVTNAQILASGHTPRINIEGFNRQRDVEIAKDTRRQLSLAIALKIELVRNPDEDGSPAAVSKVRLIEKLARDVKEKMQMSPELGPLQPAERDPSFFCLQTM